MLEKDIQRTILDYLRFKKYFFWRNNTGGFKDSQGHFYRFGAEGSPDIFVVNNGRIIGIEVKTPKGPQRPSQKEWQSNFQRVGGIYILARKVEDVINVL